MPNWCANTLTICGDIEKIAKFNSQLEESNGKDFFNVFVPNAEEVGKSEEWYNYNQETYGCKWNCDASDWELVTEQELRILFDSPWGPPIALYDEIVKLGFDVAAEYFEPGMCFVGRYEDCVDFYYEWGGINTVEELYEEIPADLIESWNIVECIEEREKSNEV